MLADHDGGSSPVAFELEMLDTQHNIGAQVEAGDQEFNASAYLDSLGDDFNGGLSNDDLFNDALFNDGLLNDALNGSLFNDELPTTTDFASDFNDKPSGQGLTFPPDTCAIVHNCPTDVEAGGSEGNQPTDAASGHLELCNGSQPPSAESISQNPGTTVNPTQGTNPRRHVSIDPAFVPPSHVNMRVVDLTAESPTIPTYSMQKGSDPGSCLPNFGSSMPVATAAQQERSLVSNVPIPSQAGYNGWYEPLRVTNHHDQIWTNTAANSTPIAYDSQYLEPMANGNFASQSPPVAGMPQESFDICHPAPQSYRTHQARQVHKHPMPRDLDEDDEMGGTYHHKIRNRRQGNRTLSNSAALRYPESALKPRESWGEMPNNRGKFIFNYTQQGEWLPGVIYSSDELLLFFLGPDGDGWAPGRKKLTMRIQNTPVWSNNRYPNGDLSKLCRWKKCPVKKNTIFKGQIRVAFDERPETSGVTTDPFFNTGYMHLYCLEKAFQLIEFVNDPRLHIKPDLRRFPHEERNPMSLNRDMDLVEVYKKWCSDQYKRWEAKATTGAQLKKSHRLYYALAESIVANPNRRPVRPQLGDFELVRYMGDLDLFQRLRDQHLEEDKQHRHKIAEILADSDDDGGDSGGDSGSDSDCCEREPAPSRHRPRASRAKKFKHTRTQDDRRSRRDRRMEESGGEYDPRLTGRKMTETPPATVTGPAKASRKRARSPSDDDSEFTSDDMAQEQTRRAKRPRVMSVEVKKAVTTVKTVEVEVEAPAPPIMPRRSLRLASRPVIRAVSDMIPDIAELPGDSQLQIRDYIASQLNRVRRGVVG